MSVLLKQKTIDIPVKSDHITFTKKSMIKYLKIKRK